MVKLLPVGVPGDRPRPRPAITQRTALKLAGEPPTEDQRECGQRGARPGVNPPDGDGADQPGPGADPGHAPLPRIRFAHRGVEASGEPDAGRLELCFDPCPAAVEGPQPR